uniref:glutathione transferase n=1 Tax=Panagrolaimus davidi TaxID=227884 RepID=A0A914PFL3_9BILA
MPKYKLNYFDVRGFGEIPRLIFNYAGQEFEDRRWAYSDWPEVKHESETGKSPWLEVDDERIYESGAINRYLATTFGLAGKDPMENAQIDSIFDIYKDAFKEAAGIYMWVKSPYYNQVPVFYHEIVEKQYGKLEDMKPKYDEANEFYWPLVQKRLDKSGTGFFVSKLSWADFFLADKIETAMNLDKNFEKKFPKMIEYKNRIHSESKIQEYLKNRKESFY